MAARPSEAFRHAGIGLDYVWIEGGPASEGDVASELLSDGEALRVAVAEAIIRSPWPLRGRELSWLRDMADMGMPLFARATGRPVAEATAWEAAENADMPREADRALRPWLASLLGLEDEALPTPSPQPEEAERRLIARRDHVTGRWKAEMPVAELDPERLVALAEASDDPIVHGLLALLRSEAAAAERARELLAADLSLLRAGPTSLGFTMETAGRAVAMLAGQMATWLREHEAENYTETEFTHHETPYTITVQRRTGRTPHQLRIVAEERVAALQAELREALAAESADVGAKATPPSSE